MTPRDGLSLLCSVVAATRLIPLAIGSVLGVGIVGTPIALGQKFEMFDVAAILHLALIVVLVAGAYVLDDPAQNMVAVTGIGPLRLRIIRLTLATVFLAPVWTIIVVLLPHLAAAGGRPIPRLALAIEGPALALWVWAVASVGAAGQRDGSGGVVAAPFVILCGIGLTMLPSGLRLFSNPDDVDFDASRARWVIVLAAGLTALTIAVARPDSLDVRRVRSATPVGRRSAAPGAPMQPPRRRR